MMVEEIFPLHDAAGSQILPLHDAAGSQIYCRIMQRGVNLGAAGSQVQKLCKTP
jgi:hypothetical protein